MNDMILWLEDSIEFWTILAAPRGQLSANSARKVGDADEDQHKK